MLVLAAMQKGFPFGFADKFFRSAKRNTLLNGEALGAFADEHHVRTMLEDFAREANGVLYSLQVGGGAGAKRGAVHDDGVALHAAVEIEMRAEASVEDGIVFERDDGSFHGF